MSSMNVSLRLTEDPEILAQLEANGAFKQRGGTTRKPEGPKTYIAQAMNGQAFEFEPGKVITVPDNVARALYSQGVLFGGTPTEWGGRKFNSALDADYVPVLEIVEKWAVGEEQPSARRSRKTTCPLCNTDQGTVERLKNHMLECEEDTAAVADLKTAAV